MHSLNREEERQFGVTVLVEQILGLRRQLPAQRTLGLALRFIAVSDRGCFGRHSRVLGFYGIIALRAGVSAVDFGPKRQSAQRQDDHNCRSDQPAQQAGATAHALLDKGSLQLIKPGDLGRCRAPVARFPAFVQPPRAG